MAKNPSHRIAERWTPELLDWGFTPVVNVLIDNYVNLGIAAQELLLIIHLMRFKWDSEHPFPSYTTLSKKMGLHPRRVKQIARDLEDKSFLVRVERREQPRSRTNQFDLTGLFDALDEIVRLERQRKELMGRRKIAK